MSSLVDEPLYQLAAVGSSVNKTLHKHRGIPRCCLQAGVAGGVIAVWDLVADLLHFRWHERRCAAWSGIIADLDQVRGRHGFHHDGLITVHSLTTVVHGGIRRSR